MLMEDKDQIIEEIAVLVENREVYQRKIGKYAWEYRQKFGGVNSLKELAEDLKERHGLVISYKTLHNYSWVEEKLSPFEIPDDVAYRLRQLIAGTDDPKKWVDLLLAGATSKELFEAIKGKKAQPLIECPKCHFAFEKPTYADARAKAQEAIKDFKY